jgi:hypothetical protein
VPSSPSAGAACIAPSGVICAPLSASIRWLAH